jgi:hypothetical protein
VGEVLKSERRSDIVVFFRKALSMTELKKDVGLVNRAPEAAIEFVLSLMLLRAVKTAVGDRAAVSTCNGRRTCLSAGSAPEVLRVPARGKGWDFYHFGNIVSRYVPSVNRPILGIGNVCATSQRH